VTVSSIKAVIARCIVLLTSSHVLTVPGLVNTERVLAPVSSGHEFQASNRRRRELSRLRSSLEFAQGSVAEVGPGDQTHSSKPGLRPREWCNSVTRDALCCALCREGLGGVDHPRLVGSWCQGGRL
jgi:hypothetical protein